MDYLIYFCVPCIQRAVAGSSCSKVGSLSKNRGLVSQVKGLRWTTPSVFYNVNGAGLRVSCLKVSAMWFAWIALLVTCALCDAAPAQADGTSVVTGGVATTARAPPRTLDRKAAELAWRTWLQSPESGNQNAPPRRITTKSLFITPLVCPKGQRLDRDGCVQVVTVNKDDHESILLEQLNALFTSAPGSDVLYDYGDNEPGPLQLSIPISLEPQAAPLQANEPGQSQDLQPDSVKVDKKGAKPSISLEAELELLKIQTENERNNTVMSGKPILSQNAINNFLPFPDKPKRDTLLNKTQTTFTENKTDEGQKELVFGHVNVDPVLYYQNQETYASTTVDTETEIPSDQTTESNNDTTMIDTETTHSHDLEQAKITTTENHTAAVSEAKDKPANHELKKDSDKTNLNPENDYSDIGEAIKLISRYAEVTTDDNFSKDQKKNALKDDSVLGTRTRLQHRRNKPKPSEAGLPPRLFPFSSEMQNNEKIPSHSFYPKSESYYRYPWQDQHSQTPPPDYPFRHLQDYWPGRTHFGGVYNAAHENPRRHHHSYPHSYYRPHSGYPSPYLSVPNPYPGPQEIYRGQYPGQLQRLVPHHADPMRSRTSNQDLYSLLGLRNWFISEGNVKR